MPPKKRRRKSAKRVAAGRKLARELPRDKSGKFLPKGSRNLFKRKAKGKRRRSVPAKRRKTQAKAKRRRRRRSAPAMPRGRRGRTKDDFPNFLSGFIEQQGVDDFVEKTINTPIPRLKTVGNRATVMELLYCDISAPFADMTDVAGTGLFFQMRLGGSQTSFVFWDDTRVFVNFRLTFGPTLPGPIESQTPGQAGMPWRYQFQTMDGFGYLLAADSFKIALTTVFMLTQRVSFKLFYRFVDIPLSEFIGIVQSTQAQ